MRWTTESGECPGRGAGHPRPPLGHPSTTPPFYLRQLISVFIDSNGILITARMFSIRRYSHFGRARPPLPRDKGSPTPLDFLAGSRNHFFCLSNTESSWNVPNPLITTSKQSRKDEATISLRFTQFPCLFSKLFRKWWWNIINLGSCLSKKMYKQLLK